MTQPNNSATPSVVATSVEVSNFHKNCDADSHLNAQHHTLGIGHSQGSPGDHTHNGKNSKLVGKGQDLTFPTTANAAYTQSQLQSIINALRDLGFGV